MKGVHFLLALTISALATSIASAHDPVLCRTFASQSMTQNEPVRGPNSCLTMFVNGKCCKNPELVNANDFYTSGLNIPGNTNNKLGFNVTTVNVDRIPGLNTLGVSLVPFDYAPYGQNPPHTHPRATEILVVVEGTLYTGFVSSNQDGNRLFTKVLYKGDVFVFPIGMIHFQFNPGHAPTVASAGLGSQNPGVITTANTVFGSNPSINPEVLARAGQLDQKVVEQLQKKFWVDAN